MRNALRSLLVLGCLLSVLFGGPYVLADLQPERLTLVGQGALSPQIVDLRPVTQGDVPRYGKYEATFGIANTTATNPYFPYEPVTPPGVEAGIGITVDAFLLPPGQTDWSQARWVPCFYYQPVEELGSGEQAGFVPTGPAEWRLRFAPDIEGVWQFKVRATDAGGSGESAVESFTCVASDSKGYIQVSPTDPRFFEYADGTPFTSPLINLEEGSPFGSLAKIRSTIATLGSNGMRFVRWFAGADGANYYVVPFGDRLSPSWCFGDARTSSAGSDTAAGSRFMFSPYYYSAQNVPAIPGASYKLTFRAIVTGDRVLRAQIANRPEWQMDVCSATAKYHESVGCACNERNADWQTYELIFTNTSYTSLNVALRGMYSSADAPTPFNKVQTGSVRISWATLQRDETGDGGWGPNLLNRSNAETYSYVDQVGAARMDEVMRLSEEFGVYHKLPLFHKNDQVLNAFAADGSTTAAPVYPNNFYSGEGQAARWYEDAYTRYFVARWSYSTALHSLELANENDLSEVSYNAGYHLAEMVHALSPRHILMSNSFWGWWVSSYWTDPVRGDLMDYSDKHWYSNQTGSSCTDGFCELISNVWDDSAAYVREATKRFNEYRRSANYSKPIVRGEGGTATSGTEPQMAQIAQDARGTYYHKKLWAHVGALGGNCDGEWYPRVFVSGGAFPNPTYNLPRMYAAYERFLQGEPLSNGQYTEVGSDLAGDAQVSLAVGAGALRAWGVRDAYDGRALLWIDNPAHTWANVVAGKAVPAASGTLTVPGMPMGGYWVEWWDTTEGVIRSTGELTVGADGLLALSVSGLSSDVAVRCMLYTRSVPVMAATALPTHTPQPTQTPLLKNTALPTATLRPTATRTSVPTAALRPTATRTSVPTA
ncbi:MAG: DUF5060 domain-containing protein, partial [Chloroflexi bacterium]|nr:DUF5060 domain-containing protein [Chloroflexota bacterium]